MRKTGKKFAAARQQVPERAHTIEDAVPLMQKVKFAKFDETVEIALRLGVDPKHADQMVRGTVVLPHGLGKSKRVLAIAGAEKQKEETEAGAGFVGGGGRGGRRRGGRGRRKRPGLVRASLAVRSWSTRFRAAGWTSTPSSPRPT